MAKKMSVVATGNLGPDQWKAVMLRLVGVETRIAVAKDVAAALHAGGGLRGERTLQYEGEARTAISDALRFLEALSLEIDSADRQAKLIAGRESRRR